MWQPLDPPGGLWASPAWPNAGLFFQEFLVNFGRFLGWVGGRVGGLTPVGGVGGGGVLGWVFEKAGG